LRSGGLAFIYSTTLSASTLKVSYKLTSFELQFVGLRICKILAKFCFVYRPPSSSRTIFLKEFADLPAHVGLQYNGRLVILAISTCLATRLQVAHRLRVRNVTPRFRLSAACCPAHQK
jgi:hypothetical protein